MPTWHQEHVIGRPYTVTVSTAARGVEVISMTDGKGMVFVVDDDVSVRESLELLLETAGWRPTRSPRPRNSCRGRVPRGRAAWCST